MRKLVLVFGILASVVSVSMGAMSKEEWDRGWHNCFENRDKSACQALINNGLPSAEECPKNPKSVCSIYGVIYYTAGYYHEAIPYFEKAIALGDNSGYDVLGATYDKLQDYYNAKKYLEIGCNKGNGDLDQAGSCYNLGYMYANGKGVRQDYAKAAELWKKACDMKYGFACNNLGVLYGKGQGVRQNRSTAKQYYGKACDLGNQVGCDNYKLLNSQGVR
ncbi:tetratricopeptide repeat protein [Helicobacter macacae]|uniref:Beta-lactamase n=1 Tax=Helicobacter macacae MIT 99-5501 TaxID=1357400 RepID=V8CA15_9HELI|nr:tetratricopeptide repeat protein [Helicobacter macacae]ETD24253.1 hypothetical protein HMPREF2086_01003 [Helicobacter macacae MIT 99-5501]